MPRRSEMTDAWHNCKRCGKKTHLSHMKRQRGILVCDRESCYDEALVGQRDADVARVLQNIGSSREMQPHETLTEAPAVNEDIIF